MKSIQNQLSLFVVAMQRHLPVFLLVFGMLIKICGPESGGGTGR